MIRQRLANGFLALGLLALLGGSGLLVVRYRVYQVPSPSMSPTLRPGDRIVSDAGAAGGGSIERGDIVILAPDAWPGATRGGAGARARAAEGGRSDQVKRVVALGGDALTCCDSIGRVRLNGRTVADPAVASADQLPFSVRVPAGHAFLLGDNRDLSVDSRAFLTAGNSVGTVPLSAVRGRVVGIGLPIDRARIVGRGCGKLVLGVDLTGAGLLLAVVAGLLSLRPRSRP